MQVNLVEDTGIVTAAQVKVSEVHPVDREKEPGKIVEVEKTGDEDGEKVVDLIPTMTDADKHAKLVKIMTGMSAGNGEHYDAAGMPRIDFLIMALDGVDVSSAERDAAFSELSIKGTIVSAEVPLTAGQRIDKIVATIQKLKVADFTDKHIPKVSTLSKACGFDVEGAERDAAFAVFVKANPDWKPVDAKVEGEKE
jgi:hypothetical protein